MPMLLMTEKNHWSAQSSAYKPLCERQTALRSKKNQNELLLYFNIIKLLKLSLKKRTSKCIKLLWNHTCIV